MGRKTPLKKSCIFNSNSVVMATTKALAAEMTLNIGLGLGALALALALALAKLAAQKKSRK